MKRFLLFLSLFFPITVLAVNTEALLTLSSSTENQYFNQTGQYQYIAPICDLDGCYQTNHIQQWIGTDKPIEGYQVIYTRLDGSIKSDNSLGLNNLTNDWTVVKIITPSTTPKI